MVEDGKNKIKVNIAGRELIFQSGEDNEYFLEIVKYVNDIQKEKQKETSTNLDSIILTALHITDELFKLRKEKGSLENSLNEYTQLLTNKVKNSLSD